MIMAFNTTSWPPPWQSVFNTAVVARVILMSGSDVISQRFLISHPRFCLITNRGKMVIWRAPVTRSSNIQWPLFCTKWSAGPRHKNLYPCFNCTPLSVICLSSTPLGSQSNIIHRSQRSIYVKGPQVILKVTQIYRFFLNVSIVSPWNEEFHCNCLLATFCNAMKPLVPILYTHLIWQYLVITESQQPFWQEIEALTFLFCWGQAGSRYSCASGHAGKALLNGKEPFKMSLNSSHVCHCLYMCTESCCQNWIIPPFCFIFLFLFLPYI